jgi:hypothetical protein
MSTDSDRTRMLNDELRKNLLGGGAVITAGIAELGAEAVERLVKTIAVFDDAMPAILTRSTISASLISTVRP